MNEVYRSRKVPIRGTYSSYTLSYRHQEIDAIYRLASQRECISMIGVGTVGKTHLIQHLTHKNVFAHYQNLYADVLPVQPIFVTIDPNALLVNTDNDTTSEEMRSWMGFELIIKCLIEQAALNQLAKTVSVLTEIYLGLVQDLERAYYFAFRELENCIDILLTTEDTPPSIVVLIFDEFERLFQLMPASFFINLRALRDQKRYQLLMMTLSRLEIYNLAQGEEHLQKKINRAEAFFELFKNPVYVGPTRVHTNTHGDLDEGDLIELTRSLNERLRYGQELSWQAFDNITTLVGGHSGLLRTVLLMHTRFPLEDINKLFTVLISDPSIKHECEILLRSCSIREQQLLTSFVAQTRTDGYLQPTNDECTAFGNEIRALFEKGLIAYVETHQLYAVIPTVFRYFIQHRKWYEENWHRFDEPANPRPNGPSISAKQPPKPPTLPET